MFMVDLYILDPHEWSSHDTSHTYNGLVYGSR